MLDEQDYPAHHRELVRRYFLTLSAGAPAAGPGRGGGAVTDLPAEAGMQDALDRIAALRREIERRIVGHRRVVEGILAALLAAGHVLLEGVPGLGKTLLVKSLSDALHLEFARVQFTPDLMPADIVGTRMVMFDEAGGRHFRFQPGPVFTQLLLADEINRATPKTQSALLEAMEERMVTVGRTGHPCRSPSWCSRPRTRSKWKAPTRFPRPSSIASSSS